MRPKTMEVILGFSFAGCLIHKESLVVMLGLRKHSISIHEQIRFSVPFKIAVLPLFRFCRITEDLSVVRLTSDTYFLYGGSPERNFVGLWRHLILLLSRWNGGRFLQDRPFSAVPFYEPILIGLISSWIHPECIWVN